MSRAACRCRASIMSSSRYWYDFGGDLTPEEFGLEAAAAVEKKILEARA